MSAEGLLQQHSGMGFGKAKKNLDENSPRYISSDSRIKATDNWPRSASISVVRSSQRPKKLLGVNGNSTKRNANLNWRLHGSDKRKRLRAEPPSETLRRHALPPSKKPSAKQNLAEAEQERQAEIEAAREQEKLESR